MKPSISILTEFEHPWGLRYIEELIKHNIKIDQIIFTQKKDYLSIVKLFKERMGEDFIMPKTKDILGNKRIPCYFIDDINSDGSNKLIKALYPDIIIQAAQRIIKERLLNLPKFGILNCHPGLFPKYRGCTCVEWAIYNDDPVGCTCHFITEKIDWGDVIIMETLKIKRGDSYNEVRKQSMYHCAEVLVKAIKKIIQNKYIPGEIKLNENEKKYFKPIDDEKMIVVKNMLEEKKYSHYID